MFESIKRLTQHSLVYGIGHILSRFVGFLLLPIHTNYLLPDAYGTAALLFSSLAILNIIFTYGMDVAFLRFFILEEKQEGKQKIFSTVFWTILGTGVCFSAVLVLLPEPFAELVFRSSRYAKLIQLAGGILLADALSLIPFLVLRSEEKSIHFVVIKFINIVLNLGFNILFVIHLNYGVFGIFLANLLASAATLSILLPIIFNWLRFQFHKSRLMELLRFGLPYIPAGLALLIMDQIGRFFLDRMVGKAATGIFSASYKLGMFMALVVAAFRFAWHPFFLSTSRERNAPQIYARVLTYFLTITGCIFLIVSFFIQEIIRIHLFGIRLFGEGFAAGTSIVPIVLLSYICYGIYVNFIVGIYLKKKTVYLPIVTGIGALIGILMNFLLVPHFDIMGAAWATFLAYSSMAVALYAVNQRLYPIQYEWTRILKIVFSVFLIFIVQRIWFDSSHIGVRLLLVMGYFPLLWIERFLNAEEKEFFINKFVRFKS